MSDARRGKVQTVTGLIEPGELGKTLMHEHLLIDLNPPHVKRDVPDTQRRNTAIEACDCFKLNWNQKSSPANFRLHDLDVLTQELREMRSAGGESLVELTVGGLEPDPEGLVALARSSGVQIIMGCGHYVSEYQDPANASRPVEDFAAEIVTQLTTGAWGTDVKAGIIGEIGCQSPWTDQEKNVLRGALLAQQHTGAALNVHPGRSVTQPQEVVDFVRAFGNPTSRLIVSHVDRTLFELGDLLRLADSGCMIEFDLFGWETTNYFPNPAIDMPNDGMRLKLIRSLLDRGHLEQILISHDICMRSRLCRYGGHGYQHIFANVVPLMLRRNFSHAEVDAILVANPARLLSLQ